MKYRILSLPFLLSVFALTLLQLSCKTIKPVLKTNNEVAERSMYQIISKGEAAGSYQAFPDATRLKNGDIVAVFYAGTEHITPVSNKYPKAGRLCMVRSKDEGKTWTEPITIYDDLDDNRDPHISEMADGTLFCSFFSLTPDKKNHHGYKPVGKPQIITSSDGGKNWDEKAQTIDTGTDLWFCSAQVREMSNGTLMLPIYHQQWNAGVIAWGGVILSNDKGKTWGSAIPIGEKANLPLAAETDIVQLKNGDLYALLRGQNEVNMHASISKDFGKSWSPVKDMGFRGHAPSFTRLKNNMILLSYRGFNGNTGYTALRISRDEGKTWEGPYMIDEIFGAYTSTIELKDKSVLVVYYEEGKNSAIRARRIKVPGKATVNISTKPQQLVSLPLD